MKRGVIYMLIPLLLFLCSAAAQAQGNSVSLQANNLPLTDALSQVERQSGYFKVSYSVNAVKDYRVTATISNASAPDAVRQLINGLPLAVQVDGKIITVQPSRLVQRADNKTADKVVGTVSDTDGEPLVGVTVKVKGSDTGVISDIDGHFELAGAHKGDIIQFSYVGKLPLERKATGRKMNIILEDNANTMKDVVVTGYQTISKERATGSFAKVTADDLKSKRYDNLSQLLEGEVAGYDSKTNTVRGITTMNGVSQPLFVIDGFPVENTRYNDYGSLEESIPNLNIEDIESITVLKDAAAASIYGARAANGVVVIVTKKAKAKRTSVSFSTSLTYHPYKLYTDRLASAADMVDLERQWAEDNPNLQGDDAQSYAQSLLDNNVYTTQGIKAILNYYAGQTSQEEMEATLSNLASKGYQYYDQVKKYAKRDAFYQQYHLNVGHASDHNNFTASLTYRNNKMNDRYTNDNSWGIDLKDRMDLTRWLHLEVGNYTYYKKAKTQTYDPLDPGYTYMPYDALKNEDGTNYTNTAADRLSSSDQAILDSYGLYSLDITPLDEISKNIRNTNSFVNRTYGKLDFDIFSWLKYNVMFQYEYAYDKTKLLYDKTSYYVRSLVDQYATDDDGTGVATYNVPYGNILYRVNQTSKAYTFRQQLNFDKTFGGLHNVVALVGHEVRKNVVDYDNSTLYNYDPDMLSFSLVDQSVLSNTYGLMGGYGLSSNDFAYLRYVDNRYVSFYANAAYTYDDRYMASASIRWDRSNLWGTNSKYQDKPIWSLGTGWNIDKEQWFKVSWIDRLKLRVSYGIAGNVAKNAAPYMTAYYYQNDNLGGTYGVVAGRPNPTLRWEKTTTTNIGLDFALFHNRLNGTIEYYNKMGTDLLANTMGVPTEGFGYTTYQVNNGKMRNRGFEIQLNGDIISTRNFGLSATATYSYNKNKVIYVNVEAPVYFLQLDYPEAYPVVGNAYHGIYGYRWAGLSSDGLPQVYDADGNAVTYNPADLDAICYLGSTDPTSIASLTLNFRYKDFTASCLWTYQGGHKMRNTDLPMLGNSYNYALYSYVTALGPVNKGITDRWRQSGDEATTNVPAAIFAENSLFSSDSYDIYRYADINVISATNLQLSNISLAYNLPVVWLKPIHLSSARVQFNIENVCTFAHSKAAKYLLGGYDAPNYVLGIYIDL